MIYDIYIWYGCRTRYNGNSSSGWEYESGYVVGNITNNKPKMGYRPSNRMTIPLPTPNDIFGGSSWFLLSQASILNKWLAKCSSTHHVAILRPTPSNTQMYRQTLPGNRHFKTDVFSWENSKDFFRPAILDCQGIVLQVISYHFIPCHGRSKKDPGFNADSTGTMITASSIPIRQRYWDTEIRKSMGHWKTGKNRNTQQFRHWLKVQPQQIKTVSTGIAHLAWKWPFGVSRNRSSFPSNQTQQWKIRHSWFSREKNMHW